MKSSLAQRTFTYSTRPLGHCVIRDYLQLLHSPPSEVEGVRIVVTSFRKIAKKLNSIKNHDLKC